MDIDMYIVVITYLTHGDGDGDGGRGRRGWKAGRSVWEISGVKRLGKGRVRRCAESII